MAYLGNTIPTRGELINIARNILYVILLRCKFDGTAIFDKDKDSRILFIKNNTIHVSVDSVLYHYPVQLTHIHIRVGRGHYEKTGFMICPVCYCDLDNWAIVLYKPYSVTGIFIHLSCSSTLNRYI